MATSSRSFGIELSNILLDTVRKDSSNLTFFLGGETGDTIVKNTVEDDSEVWENINFVQNIRESDVSMVVRRVNWQSGQVYYPYDSAGISAGATGAERNYYALTDEDEVYLCLGADEKNRSNNFGRSNSTIKPNRAADNQILSDGYRWKFLYKIDLAKTKFKTTNYMPVVDISNEDGFSSKATINEDVFRRGCGFSSGETGSCCFYYNEPEKDQVNAQVFGAGDFDFCVDDTLCSTCYRIAKKMNRNYIFNLGATCGTSTGTGDCPSTNRIKRGYEHFLDQLQTLSPTSNEYLQSTTIRDAVNNDGQIQSVSLNLEGLTTGELETLTPSPIIGVNSRTGTGGNIRLTTEAAGFSAGNPLYVINGIELKTSGTKYRDVTLSDVPSVLDGRLGVNLDYPGGLFANPARALNATKFMISVTLRTDTLPTNASTSQTTFTRYGLMRDVLSVGTASSGVTHTFKTGSEANTDEPKIVSNITKITLDQGTHFVAPSITQFSVGSDIVDTTTTSVADVSEVSSDKPVSGVGKIVSAVQGSSTIDLEVISPVRDFAKIGDRIASVGATGTNFDVTSITTPELVPFSGKVVSSNATNISLDTQPREITFTYVYSLGSY